MGTSLQAIPPEGKKYPVLPAVAVSQVPARGRVGLQGNGDPGPAYQEPGQQRRGLGHLHSGSACAMLGKLGGGEIPAEGPEQGECRIGTALWVKA